MSRVILASGSAIRRQILDGAGLDYEVIAKPVDEAAIKDAGVFRLEGKEYVVQDGDIMHFRFNV